MTAERSHTRAVLKNTHRALLRIAILTGAMAGGLAACSNEPANDAVADVTPTKTDPNSVELDSMLLTRVRIGAPETLAVASQLRLAGRLELDGYRTARIGAPVTGRITDVRALLGQSVREAEPLAFVTSQEVTAAQLAYLKAYAAEQLALRAAERADTLFRADVIAAAELQRRGSELEVARAERRSAADQLEMLGLGADVRARLERTGQIVPSAPIMASRAGTVIERRIAIGQVVQPADSLFVVSDLRHLWAVAEVPEQQVRDIHRGLEVAVEIPAAGNSQRTGRVVFIGDVVNASTHTVRVGVDLDNADRSLKPQMLMTMLVSARMSSPRPVVPSSAVVRENDRDHLFLKGVGNTVVLTPVRLGPEQDGRRALLDAFPAGTEVVLDGAFHLNTERQRRALEGASANGGAGS